MGTTTKYSLPWPELPSQADGPAAFQALALATESAIDVGGVTSKLVAQDHQRDVSGFTVGTGILYYFNTPDWVNLPAFASTVLIDVCLTVVSPNSTIGNTSIGFDNVLLVNELWNTNGAGSRTMTYAVAVSNKAAGVHGQCWVGVNTTAGGNITIPHVSYAYRALA